MPMPNWNLIGSLIFIQYIVRTNKISRNTILHALEEHYNLTKSTAKSMQNF